MAIPCRTPAPRPRRPASWSALSRRSPSATVRPTRRWTRSTSRRSTTTSTGPRSDRLLLLGPVADPVAVLDQRAVLHGAWIRQRVDPGPDFLARRERDLLDDPGEVAALVGVHQAERRGQVGQPQHLAVDAALAVALAEARIAHREREDLSAGRRRHAARDLVRDQRARGLALA